MYITFDNPKISNPVNYSYNTDEKTSLGDLSFFKKNNIFDVKEDDIEDFLFLFCLPVSKSKIENFDAKEQGKIKLFISEKVKECTIHTLNLDSFNIYKNFILSKFKIKKDTFCNEVTSLGYKYFDANSTINGNKEFPTEILAQDYDIKDLLSHNFFFVVRQFYYLGKKTSIYDEIKKYKNNQNYSLKIKNIFEKLYFNYDDLNINKIEVSNPRANIYVNIDEEYKTISPVPSISQIIYFNDLFEEVFYKKIGENLVGGAQPQNVGFFSSLYSGSFKCYENIFNFEDKSNSIYQINYNFIPKDAFNLFKERNTYKKINHLNMIISNSKTDIKLEQEINFILDDLLSLVFLTIDYINEFPEDPYNLKESENYKIIYSIVKSENKSFEIFSEKLKEEVFKNLKLSKKVKLYDKRKIFFDNIIKLAIKRIINYV